MGGKLTKGEKKILLQFERFTETDLFKEEVKRIRKLIKLPTNGIEPKEDDLKKIGEIFRVPIDFHIQKDNKAGGHPMRTLNIETHKLMEQFSIDNMYLKLLIKNYIIFNKFFYEELEEQKQYLHTANVCEIEDAQSEFDEYAPSDDPDEFYASFSVKGYINMLENKLWKYPVVLRIHPDASQRDIIEYIKTHWAQIDYYQKQYAKRSKNASFKNSKTKENTKLKERNDFIYRNKNLPRKTIMQMVNKDYGADLDQGSIGKIISLERKKREKK